MSSREVSSTLRMTLGTCLWLHVVLPTVHAETGELSVTPEGFRLSIMRISIAGSDTKDQVLYECAGASEEDCLVDVMQQSDLDALAASASMVELPVGTYDRLSLSTCKPGSSGATPAPAYLRAEFNVASESTVYYTDADMLNDSGLNTEGPAEFTKVGSWTCAEQLVVLPSPISVTAGGVTDLTVVFDGRFIASSSAATSPGMGGCKAPSTGDARGVCVAYPSLLAFVGGGTPTVSGFTLAHHISDAASIDDAKANAYVSIISEPDEVPVMAYTRPYFSETSAPDTQALVQDSVYGGPGYSGETDATSFAVNTDGTIAFSTGGDEDDAAAVFAAFAVADHVGVVETRLGDSWHYHAKPAL